MAYFDGFAALKVGRIRCECGLVGGGHWKWTGKRPISAGVKLKSIKKTLRGEKMTFYTISIKIFK